MADAETINVIDDDASLQAALGSLFRSVGYEVRLYGDTSAFLAAPKPAHPCCLVLDVRLPGLNGLDFQEQLTSSGMSMPVVLITGHGDIPMSVRGMKAGAIDFLTKPFRDQDMLDAVANAIAQDRLQRSIGEKTASLRTAFATLSPREQQVMTMVATGKMNKQVAGALDLSEITVKVHRGSAMRKMGARTLADLVRMAEALDLSQRQ